MTYKIMPGVFYWTLWPMRFLFDLYLLFRAVTIGSGRAYFRALVDGYGKISLFRDDRRRLLSTRRQTDAEFARAVAWGPLRLLRREPALRPATDATRAASSGVSADP